MNEFIYKDMYIEDGLKVLELNILPGKYCNFDCIFCPVGRSKNKTDDPIDFGDQSEAINDLLLRIDRQNPDLIFINSLGESIVNNKLADIVKLIKGKSKKVRLLSNGYILNRDEYIDIYNMADEVIGELKVSNEEHFKKIQRPIDGYSVSEHINNMSSFNNQFDGDFIFEITLIKGINDDSDSIEFFKDAINKIRPEKLEVVRIEEEIFQKKLGMDIDSFNSLSEKLKNYHSKLITNN